MSVPRITILTTTAGGGHMAAAWALRDAIGERADVTLMEFVEEHGGFPLNTIPSVYPRLVRTAPLVWRAAYEATQSPTRSRIIHDMMHTAAPRAMRDALLATRPDVVVCVYHLVIGSARKMLRQAGLDVPVVTVVTDPVSITPLWLYRDVDLCCVAEEDARRLAVRAGMAPDRVAVTGLPVREAFTRPSTRPRWEMKAELGLAPSLPMALLVAGGAGMGNLEQLGKSVARRLAADGVEAQLAFVAGSNDALRRRLEAVDWPLPVSIQGFTSDMASWMRAADVLLTKAGPGTLAEAACLGTPAVIVGFVPGQEEGNLPWARRRFGTPSVKRPSDAARVVSRLLAPSGEQELAGMAARAQAGAVPGAAADIADRVVDLAGSRAFPLPPAPPRLLRPRQQSAHA